MKNRANYYRDVTWFQDALFFTNLAPIKTSYGIHQKSYRRWTCSSELTKTHGASCCYKFSEVHQVTDSKVICNREEYYFCMYTVLLSKGTQIHKHGSYLCPCYT